MTVSPAARTLPPLVGIGGKLQHGKDVVGDQLVERGFEKVNMSSAIHGRMLILDPFVPVKDRFHREIFLRYSEVVERFGFTAAKDVPEFRRLLQVFGGQVVRDTIDKNFWVEEVAREIDRLRLAGHPVVLSGVRFPNECEIISDAGGELIWVHRPGAVATSSAASDQTETSVSAENFDVTLVNDGSIEDLQAKADAVVRRLWAERGQQTS